MAINTPFSPNQAATSGGFDSPEARARRQALRASTATNTNVNTTVSPQMPPPVAPRVTGGTAPVGVLNPNQVAYDSFGNIEAVGGKVSVPTSGAPASTGTAALITGTTSPPARTTGGTAPVATTPFPPTAQAPQQIYQTNMGAGNVVQDYLSQLLSSDSPYIQNARRTGLETAASRGLLNSSIAAGNSQRAAIEAATPILNEITNLHNQREQLAFTGEQNQADRDQQITMARINDWAANNQFQREYNGQLSLIPITSVAGLNNSLMQAAIDNPEIFPPEIVSGLGEFFGTNLLSMLQQWFPTQYGGG